MNYGRYFRLNQALSKVVSGVAIYDYIDLPAYFGPSVDNPMSPKYPINVTITSDAVSFRLHYSAFKLDKSGDSDFPQYAYDKDDIDKKTLKRKQVDIGMAHMEEVVLELPFADISSNRLSDTIKSIYNSTFPQVMDENTSMGGRYLEQLIKKRYPIEKDKESEKGKDSVEDILYRNLRKMSDETVSYSTLWLMDLVRDNRIYLYSKQKIIDDKTKKEKEIDVITGFLRKLLLDFMFDLKHSDVFQNSANYQKMFFGLMSDFYFSALMHKCEYYYYRRLIRSFLEDNAVSFSTFEGETGIKNRMITLYAEELFRAEDLWVKDIMSSQAEVHFEYHNKSLHKYKRELTETYDFSSWPSWFAEPEEEMRRVCFTMKEKQAKQSKKIDIRHICNTSILTKLLGLESLQLDSHYEVNGLIANMIDLNNTNNRQISQWFLKRYDFNDVLHLHLYKHANPIMFSILVLAIISLFVGINIRWSLIGIFVLLWAACIIRLVNYAQGNIKEKNILSKVRNKIVHIRLVINRNISLAIIIILTICLWGDAKTVCKFATDFTNRLPKCFLLIAAIMTMSLLYAVLPKLRKIIVDFRTLLRKFPSLFEPKMQRLMTNLHLLLPKLVASIAGSWITLSMGFDLYVSFFDATPAWTTIFVLLVILLLFVMYEINKVTPNSNSWLKLYRSIELIVVSYSISLIIGIFVINFLGEKYLEKGGYVGEGKLYEQYVKDGRRGIYHIEKDKYYIGKIINENDYKKNVKMLDSVYHGTLLNSEEVEYSIYPIVEHIKFLGWDILILRDFLIMFSFVTMFMGIFIQLIIFGDNKQMTEL